MRSIVTLVALAGRRIAADGVPFTDSRYARRLLMLSATLTAAVVVGLLGYATSARADVACSLNQEYCFEKEATPNPVMVGETLTFTITGFCTPSVGRTTCASQSLDGMTDTLPAGLEFVSASATGFSGPYPIFGNPPPPTCSESAGTVTCAPSVYLVDTQAGIDVPFVATIEVIPTQCGTFTNTADRDGISPGPVSETFTVVGCAPTLPTTKEECKKGGWKEFGYPNQGTCVSDVNRRNRQ
jgi:hypothetical protein